MPRQREALVPNRSKLAASIMVLFEPQGVRSDMSGWRLLCGGVAIGEKDLRSTLRTTRKAANDSGNHLREDFSQLMPATA
jgi:hypothetical protein